MFERFTGEARELVVQSQERARALGHAHIGTEHLLLALLNLGPDVAARRAVEATGLTADAAEAAVLDAVPRRAGGATGHIPFTSRAKRVLELSLHESQRMGSTVIGPEHVLLGLLSEAGGVAAQVLLRDGRTERQIRDAVAAACGTAGPVTSSAHTPAVDSALALAVQLAAGAPVGSQHVLEALARIDSGVAGKALAGMGITVDALADAVDAVDLAGTTDLTPDHRAAATLTWTADGGTATLTTTDPSLVAAVTRLAGIAGGPLTGDGPLAGAFVPVHRALTAAAGALATALDPPAPPEGEQPITPSLRERLRRRRER